MKIKPLGRSQVRGSVEMGCQRGIHRKCGKLGKGHAQRLAGWVLLKNGEVTEGPLLGQNSLEIDAKVSSQSATKASSDQHTT